MIERDSGGPVYDYAQLVTEAAQAGTQFCVIENCYSACTMLLGLGPDQFGLRPDTVMGFHGAHGDVSGKPDLLATLTMSAGYPVPVRDWFRAGPAHLGPNQIARVKGEWFIENGYAAECTP